MNKKVYIVSAKRTAIGNFLGSLSSVPAHILGSHVIKSVLNDTRLDPMNVSEVIMGQILTGGEGQNPARQASIDAGIGYKVPAYCINQVCGSGLKSVALAASAILNGDSEVVIAGGQENMSLSKHACYMRNGYRMGNAQFNDLMLYDGLTDIFSMKHMGITAENIANQFNVSREDQDDFAFLSQQKASQAHQAGKFKSEIVPVTIKKKKEEIEFSEDEFIRHDASVENLSKLRPAFDKDGTVTAGNSSGINDGAAAVMVVSEDALKKYNLTPLCEIVSYGQAGVDPNIMGTGPVPASELALKKANWNINDLDLIEANEAFAAQAVYVNRTLGWDTSKVNVNGGAIALGHPIGASGTRILVTLLHEMQRNPSVKKGLATLCIGGGMGIAICVQKV